MMLVNSFDYLFLYLFLLVLHVFTVTYFQMSGGRPTLSLTRRTPLKSRKNITATTTKKKSNNGNLGMAVLWCNGLKANINIIYNCNVLSVVSNSNNSHNSRAWVDTVTDLNQYKPSQEELDQRKVSRKSNNKLLAKVNGCCM